MRRAKPVIFVVDDDQSVRGALRRLIRSAGLNVETFASVQEFLNQGHRVASGCLVVDVKMPGVNGLDFQEQLVASGHKMPIIFITAHEDIQARARAMRAGAVDFLQKPFHDQCLLDAIFVALEQETSAGSRPQ